MSENKILSSEHVFVAGRTGTGKTHLTKFYNMYNEKTVLVLDTKGRFEWDEIPKKSLVLVDSLDDVQKYINDYPRIIYRPKREELTNDHYNAFFEFCYYLGDNTVIVDEAMQVCQSALKMPEFYNGILTRGRELNVNIWSCTQRPANIPVSIYSESSHWFVFALNAMQDRKRIAESSGYDDFKVPIPDRVFYYYNANTTSPPQKGKLK